MKPEFSTYFFWTVCGLVFSGYATCHTATARQRVRELLGDPVDSVSAGRNTLDDKHPGDDVGRSQRSHGDRWRLPHGVKDASLQEHLARQVPTISREMEDIRMASEHFLRIRRTARCDVPTPRVLRVKDSYPDHSREYLPRCTVLHRCGDDSGCCDSDQYQCAPKSVQEVVLYFHTIQLHNHSGEVSFTNSVSKLLFTNHTECECRPINHIPQSPLRHHKLSLSQRKPGGKGLPSAAPTAATTSLRVSTDSTIPTEVPDSLKCQSCPQPFSRRLYGDGRCSCDCAEKHKTCMRIKLGNDVLDDLQRRCVETQDCHVPECEYGLYDVDSGRCPKRPDFLPRHTEQRRPYPHSHRWQFIERD